MKARSFFYIPLLVFLSFSLLLVYTPARAFPVLPSSFYGKVQVDGSNAEPGTTIRALISNQVFAEGETIIYEGNSVYSLIVPGDDSDTPEIDGGREGDQIIFEIGGAIADQPGEWHTGTNVELNLTASSPPGQVEPGEDTPPPSMGDQPIATPLPNNSTATAQVVESSISLQTATIVPAPSTQAGNEINTPSQIEQAMYETAVFEDEQQVVISTELPLASPNRISNAGSPETTTGETLAGGLLSTISPFALLLGIGAVAVLVGIIFWVRANWM